MFADKRQWGPDEFEQVRALEQALDEARRDFQELSPLVNGQFYYENDRRSTLLSSSLLFLLPGCCMMREGHFVFDVACLVSGHLPDHVNLSIRCSVGDTNSNTFL